MKKILSFSLLFLTLLASATSAKAFCPICTFAVAGGVGLSRWLGIDDTVTGIWIGAFIVSTIMWTNNYLKSRGVKFFGFQAIVIILYYALIFVPLYKYQILGHHLNRLWGIDKLILGTAIGSVGFFIGVFSYSLIKKKRGKAHFHFQKIVMAILPILILSAVFYFITRHR